MKNRVMKIVACLIPYKPWRDKIRSIYPRIFIDRYLRCKFSRLHYKEIPIYIISFNRLDCLKQLVFFLESHGYNNINIIDNNSSYPPLLDYLHSCPYPVNYLKENLGHLAFWRCNLFDEVIKKSLYVVTDPDILPINECPEDFLKVFYDILCKYPMITKVGFSLKLDDLPEHYELRDAVIEWERRFYTKQIGSVPCPYFKSYIDTTFALYGPQKKSPVEYQFYEAIRVGFPYEARHLPWYKDTEVSSEEDLFYLQTCDKDVTTWSGALDSSDIEKRYGL